MLIEILFKILLFKGGVLIYAEHCIYIHTYTHTHTHTHTHTYIYIYTVFTPKSETLVNKLNFFYIHENSTGFLKHQRLQREKENCGGENTDGSLKE